MSKLGQEPRSVKIKDRSLSPSPPPTPFQRNALIVGLGSYSTRGLEGSAIDGETEAKGREGACQGHMVGLASEASSRNPSTRGAFMYNGAGDAIDYAVRAERIRLCKLYNVCKCQGCHGSAGLRA